jgi:hypothetical protein
MSASLLSVAANSRAASICRLIRTANRPFSLPVSFTTNFNSTSGPKNAVFVDWPLIESSSRTRPPCKSGIAPRSSRGKAIILPAWQTPHRYVLGTEFVAHKVSVGRSPTKAWGAAVLRFRFLWLDGEDLGERPLIGRNMLKLARHLSRLVPENEAKPADSLEFTLSKARLWDR